MCHWRFYRQKGFATGFATGMPLVCHWYATGMRLATKADLLHLLNWLKKAGLAQPRPASRGRPASSNLTQPRPASPSHAQPCPASPSLAQPRLASSRLTRPLTALTSFAQPRPISPSLLQVPDVPTSPQMLQKFPRGAQKHPLPPQRSHPSNKKRKQEVGAGFGNVHPF